MSRGHAIPSPLPVIGLAHGSRDPRAAQTIAELMREVEALRPGLLARPAFLDLSEPDLTTVVGQLRDECDVHAAVVLPLLFTEAFHATVDAPTAVAQAELNCGVELRLGEILGLGDDVLEALEDSAARAHIGAHEAILLLAVGSSREEANVAVHDLAYRWSQHRVGPVWAGFATTGEPSASAVFARALAKQHRIGVVPLFLAPGLLLDSVRREAMAIDAEVAQPLGTALAELVLQRYDEARAAAHA
jgi:sirohydrochlorin ferrochelatase